MTSRSRIQESDGYNEAWYAEQCGGCRFWVPLDQWGTDWGACSNPSSPHDGTVRFEHDGCEHHEPSDDWVAPTDS